MREHTILAIALFRPDLIPLLIENCSQGFRWKEKDSQTLFRSIAKKIENGKTPTDLGFSAIKNELAPFLSDGFWSTLTGSVKGIPASAFETEFYSLLKTLKAEYGQESLKKELSEHSQGILNWDVIEGIVERSKVMRLERENSTMKSVFASYQEMLSNSGKQITLGYSGIDNCFRGLRNGELLTIFGAPGVLKTMVALNMMANIIPQVDGKIGFFSLEMPKASIGERWLQILSGMSDYEVSEAVSRNEPLGDRLIRELGSINTYEHTYSTAEIESIIKRDKLKVVFIDSLNVIRSTATKSYERVSKLITEVKQFTKDKEIISIVIHHRSRSQNPMMQNKQEIPESAKPVELHHLRDSGRIEEACDFVIGMWRPALNPGSDLQWWKEATEEIIVMKLLKNRRGKLNAIQCSFNHTNGRINEIDNSVTEKKDESEAQQHLH